VDVANFHASKSQRRCWRRNADVSVALTRPGLSQHHLDLFNRYHADMHQRRGWPLHETDAADYATSFLLGNFDFAYELRFIRADQLIGVGLVDITPRCASSVYFYHDPAWREAGPGVFSLLAELRVAAQLGLQYHYLGYWIAACGSMAYKSQYRPHELLAEFVADDQVPLWTDDDAEPNA
jgi:arginine-tRNA-protein transferase